MRPHKSKHLLKTPACENVGHFFFVQLRGIFIMVRNKSVTVRTWHSVSVFLILIAAAMAAEPAPSRATNIFSVKGIVKEIKSGGQTLVIQHEAIPNFMEAMTMPLRVKDPKTVQGIAPGTLDRKSTR